MKNIMYKAFLLIACSLCVLSCADLEEEVAALNQLNQKEDNQKEEQEESGQEDVVDNTPFFSLNTGTAYLSSGYTYIYCDHNGGDNASVTFPDAPSGVNVSYNPSTHIIKIEKLGSFDYYDVLRVRAVVNNKVFTSTVALYDSSSDGYGTNEEYEVNAATETFTVDISKNYYTKNYYDYYYFAVLVDGDSWVTGITPTGAVNYLKGNNSITLTFPPNTTGKARTAQVKVYPIKYRGSYSSTYDYAYQCFYNIKLTQAAQ